MATETENLTAVLYEAQRMGFEKRRVPTPSKREVLVRVNSVGICGSDVHYWWSGRTGRFVVESPLVLGHESSGTVVKCGPDVRNLKPGDRVAIEPGVPCRSCHHCKVGRYNICPDVKFCATPPVDGTLTQYFTHPEDFCFKLPAHVSLEEGAMLEPLSVAVYSCKRAEVGVGSRVLILGAGPIGLVSLLTAKYLGAACVCVTDINQERLDFATAEGANCCVNVRNKSARDCAREVVEAMGDSPTAIIECSGAESSYQLGIMAGAPKSIMVTVGRGPYDVTIPLCHVTNKEMDIRGIFRYANCYDHALNMVASGRVDVGPLITHRFAFEDVLNAFQTAKDGRAIKVMIQVS